MIFCFLVRHQLKKNQKTGVVVVIKLEDKEYPTLEWNQKESYEPIAAQIATFIYTVIYPVTLWVRM